jgi:cytochrome c556
MRRFSVLMFATVFPALASAYTESIKPLMREMKATTREAGSMAHGAFDAAKARSILETYAAQGERAVAISNAANRARFHTFIADARAAASTVSTTDQFKNSLVKLTGQCRSCHDAN